MDRTRKNLPRTLNLILLFTLFPFSLIPVSCESEGKGTIDRFALVNRHNILVEKVDSLASLSLGNGEFAFTTGITGLQTFYKAYEQGISLGTMSNWGWHSMPDTTGYDLADTYRYHTVKGREIPYSVQPRGSGEGMRAADYFRQNPHRLHLGIIRLVVRKKNGDEIGIEDVRLPKHALNLWTGKITSQFEVEGEPVEVEVSVHQEMDLVSARITSPLVAEGKIAVEWLFPYGSTGHTGPGYDFDAAGKHSSVLERESPSSALIHRILDKNHYYVQIDWNGKAVLENPGKHRFVLRPGPEKNSMEFSCLFSGEPGNGALPGFNATVRNSEEVWEQFWMNGGAVDFSGCTDPRANELERRTVLSQYLTRINGSGSLPPQETGLTMNSWYGKFHMEMIWWHSAHFANWNRSDLMADQLNYYDSIYQTSLDYTRLQGYKGVRWPKMVGPDGVNSPSSVGNYLIWQQPHPIYLLEQCYRANPSLELLQEKACLVFATADFMADLVVRDTSTGQFNLEPPLIPAQEIWRSDITRNPPFELAYWYWGLTMAQEWKKRLGQEPDPLWEEVRNNLPPPFAVNGLYMGTGNAPDSYTNPRNMRDHPIVLGMLGMLPGWDKVDPEILRNTLKLVMDQWNWPSTWGWDYPMVAMCATRLLEPEIAIDALFMETEKNRYLANGHNYQDRRLRLYLPGNGGLLKAVALMCAGWEGCTVENPGFPKDGTWNVKWEQLSPDF